MAGRELPPALKHGALGSDLHVQKHGTSLVTGWCRQHCSEVMLLQEIVETGMNCPLMLVPDIPSAHSTDAWLYERLDPSIKVADPRELCGNAEE